MQKQSLLSHTSRIQPQKVYFDVLISQVQQVKIESNRGIWWRQLVFRGSSLVYKKWDTLADIFG